VFGIGALDDLAGARHDDAEHALEDTGVHHVPPRHVALGRNLRGLAEHVNGWASNRTQQLLHDDVGGGDLRRPLLLLYYVVCQQLGFTRVRRRRRGGGGRQAPGLDEPPERVVRGEVGEGEWLAGDRAGGVAGGEPALDGAAVVGDAGGRRDGVLHGLQRDGAHQVLTHAAQVLHCLSPGI